MASRYDIKYENGDVYRSAQGDFVFDKSDEQHIEDTIIAAPGWWKEFPTDGVNIRAFLGGPLDRQTITKKLRLQLSVDGYTVGTPTINISPLGEYIINPNATI